MTREETLKTKQSAQRARRATLKTLKTETLKPRERAQLITILKLQHKVIYLAGLDLDLMDVNS